MIRFVKEDEIDKLVSLCKAHAEYERAVYDPQSKKELLLESLFSKPPKLFCLVALIEQRIVGYASYMLQYSTWDANSYIYMDCLYLSEDARGNGLGEKMINRIKDEAINHGCDLIQWQTPDFNKRAIKFYQRIGAFSKSKERFFLKL